MCRLTAYIGPQIPLERIIVLPKHSLLEQSQNALEAKLSVNGDGFGIAWYCQDNTDNEPGLYRDVLPAWSDGNLTNICRMVRSPLFLAHVRASTVGETSRSNCHPFTYKNWSFVHNGIVGQFADIRRELEASLSDELYESRRGSTDSELLFLLTIQNGLDRNPKQAVEKTLLQIKETRKGSTNQPDRITCVFSNGQKLMGFRYASDHKSPTLYASGELTSGGNALASEPLDGAMENWSQVADGAFISLEDKTLKTEQLSVAP